MRIVAPPANVPVLAIAAHPDDIESWCAGTLAQAIDQRAHVTLLLVTSGDKGSSDLEAQAQEVARQREQEARRAAQILGISEVIFLRYGDGEVEDTRALRRDLVEWIRRVCPFALFTHDPEHPYPPYLCHRDHRVVGRVALDAVYPLARDHLNFPELRQRGLEPHAVRQVWLFASNVAEAYVDISKGFERKLQARLAHESQTLDPEALRAGWQKRSASIGKEAALPLAEAFTILELD